MTSYNNPNDPNYLGDRDVVRDRGGSFWPWVIGLLVLLAIGWVVIEAFDRDDAATDDGAIPAAGEIRGDSGNRENTTANDSSMRDQTIGTDRGGSGMSGGSTPGASTGTNDVGNTSGGGGATGGNQAGGQ
jgi:hypothetical protein